LIPPRVIPVLLLSGNGLVKTEGFDRPRYLGDPRNAVRIFNEKEADELILLDVGATDSGLGPRLKLIEEIVSEAFMPVAYGGGVRDVETAKAILGCGVERVVVNTAAVEDPSCVSRLAERFGVSTVVGCVDARADGPGRWEVCTGRGRTRTGVSVVEHARRLAGLGAGEILVQSVERDGTMAGYDLKLVRTVVRAVGVPVVACGGAGTLEHLRAGIEAGASAVAAGSMFVYYGRLRAVLIGYPEPGELARLRRA
jgi:cyclase